MVEDDWRLDGQPDSWRGTRFRWARWWPYREGWDHDHCAFCTTEIAAQKSDHAPLDSGYVTADDGYTWVCEECFTDFQGHFEWSVISDSGSA